MIFLLKLEVADGPTVREEVIDGVTTALDVLRHEDAFAKPKSTLNAHRTAIYAADSTQIGMMTFISDSSLNVDDTDEEHY